MVTCLIKQVIKNCILYNVGNIVMQTILVQALPTTVSKLLGFKPYF